MIRLSEQYRLINEYMQAYPVDLDGLCDSLGIGLHRAYLEDGLSGILERAGGDSYKITVNAQHPETRQRFTIAHELGHYMLHRHLVGDGVDDDKAYRSTAGGKYHNTNIGPQQETEANQFAAGLLMPKSLIERAKSATGFMNAAELARLFNVSEHAMSIRLGLPYEG